MNRLCLALVIICNLRPALAVENNIKPAASVVTRPAQAPMPAPPVVTAPPAAKNPTPPIARIDARLVERSFQETQYAFLIFNLIKKELTDRHFTEAKTNEYAAKIYWEIMNEYADAFTKKKLTAQNLNCVIEAYSLPDGLKFKKLSAPNAYVAEFKDTVLKERKWSANTTAPTKTQVEQALFRINITQQIIGNIVTLLSENKLPANQEKAKPIYERIILMFQSLLSQNGSTQQSFQIFLNQLKKYECAQYFKIQSEYTNERGLKLITDKIPKQ